MVMWPTTYTEIKLFFKKQIVFLVLVFVFIIIFGFKIFLDIYDGSFGAVVIKALGKQANCLRGLFGQRKLLLCYISVLFKMY